MRPMNPILLLPVDPIPPLNVSFPLFFRALAPAGGSTQVLEHRSCSVASKT